MALALLSACLLAFPADAQARAEATPLRASLVTPTPEDAAARPPTVAPSYTPTPLPAARLQALPSAGEVNVRALPDIESELLGTIAHGSLYPVVRRYYRWYELRFDASPAGRAWVYGDLVAIEGDSSLIEVIDNLDEVAFAGGFDASGADEAAGGSANPRTVEIATLALDEARALEVVDATPLPTYTPPPTRSPFVDPLAAADGSDARPLNLPSLVPILVMAGLGSLGLLISLLRG